MTALAKAVVVALVVATPSAGTWRLLPRAPVVPDSYLTSAWTGKQLIVFGRRQVTKRDARGNPYTVRSFDVAAAYTPTTGRWRKLSPRPGPTGAYEGRYSAVWTGKEVLVWGAFDYQAYNPATNRWRLLRRPPGIGAAGGLDVWTGRELIGWGGGCCGDAFSNGVAYNPATNRWRNLAASPLAGSQHPVGAWTGRELVLLVSNLNPNGKPWPARLARAAAYDPARNTWRRLAPLPGGQAVSAVWDGREVLVLTVGGAAFALDPAANRWRRLARMPSPRVGGVAFWTGSRLLVWGGARGPGLAYDPSANRWSTFARGPLAPRSQPAAAWTGRSLLVWGGQPLEAGKPLADGAAFTPSEP
ncbi:MAG TPA: hypothetical protein VF101_02680 [Gaiellaceae bacterium]